MVTSSHPRCRYLRTYVHSGKRQQVGVAPGERTCKEPAARPTLPHLARHNHQSTTGFLASLRTPHHRFPPFPPAFVLHAGGCLYKRNRHGRLFPCIWSSLSGYNYGSCKMGSDTRPGRSQKKISTRTNKTQFRKTGFSSRYSSRSRSIIAPCRVTGPVIRPSWSSHLKSRRCHGPAASWEPFGIHRTCIWPFSAPHESSLPLKGKFGLFSSLKQLGFGRDVEARTVWRRATLQFLRTTIRHSQTRGYAFHAVHAFHAWKPSNVMAMSKSPAPASLPLSWTILRKVLCHQCL
jgi:hypothetical protein